MGEQHNFHLGIDRLDTVAKAGELRAQAAHALVSRGLRLFPEGHANLLAEMSWFLYLLECEDDSIYTGIAVDVEARFQAHKAGKGARYTRSHPPVRIMGIQEFPDRSSASKAEYEVKQLTAAQKRALCRTLPRRQKQKIVD